MEVARTVAEMRTLMAAARAGGRSVGFVPTMGALHPGHTSLIDRARNRCDVVAISIFVNPTQFGPNDDFAAYPRDEEGDLAAARRAGVDLVFLPPISEMYPEGAGTTVDVGDLGHIVEGASRPGHFAGVATVVARLLNIVQPDVVVFGQKDAQQVAVVRAMVRDLAFPVTVEVGETVRDPDGLALSSRNAYLTKEQRASAPVLFRAMKEAAKRATGPAEAEAIMKSILSATDDVEVDYALAVDPDTFGPPRSGSRALLVVAARVGATRLIDNLTVQSWS